MQEEPQMQRINEMESEMNIFLRRQVDDLSLISLDGVIDIGSAVGAENGDSPGC